MIPSSVKFLLNDKLIVINNPDPNQTILNYIRTELKKTGTKEGCSEGGCGACTIVLGELVDNKIIYKAINSCISFVPSLNCLLYTSPSPRDLSTSRMPSSA